MKSSYTPDPKPIKKCRHGHEMNDDNIYINLRGVAECKECRRIRNRNYKKDLINKGLKPNRGVRKPSQPMTVVCPDCKQERVVRQKPVSGRCRRCAVIRTNDGLKGNTLVCPCGKEFYRRHTYRAEPKFCSTECRHNFDGYKEMGLKFKNRRGRANPNFRHGDDVGRKNWNVAAKGESSCRNCGVTGISLHLHHVIPRSKFRAGRDVLLNGLPLCPQCHMRWHKSEEPIFRDVFTHEEWQWLCSVKLTGERIESFLDRRYPCRPNSVL